MAIVYKVSERAEPGVKGGGETKFCAIPYNRELVDFRDLAKEISKMSTLHTADLYGALQGLTEAIISNIMAGRSVRLNDLGIFSASFSSEMVDKKEKVTINSIKEVRLKFRPDVNVKHTLKECEFIKHYVRKKN